MLVSILFRVGYLYCQIRIFLSFKQFCFCYFGTFCCLNTPCHGLFPLLVRDVLQNLRSNSA